MLFTMYLVEQAKKMKNILSIVPYNELFFYSCFHNALFSVLKSWGKNEMLIISNSILYYKNFYKNSRFALFSRIKCVEEYNSLLMEMGVQISAMTLVDNLIEKIKECIDKQCPVILNVNGYYLEYRSDLYKKIHWPHSLLIIGYDENLKIVYVIDQSKRENQDYSIRVLSFMSLNQGYVNRIKDVNYEENIYDIDFIYLENKNYFIGSKNQFVKKFKYNYCICSDKINYGLQELQIFYEKFQRKVEERSDNIMDWEFWIEGFNDIVKQLKWKKNMILYLNNSEINKKIEEILRGWTTLRNICCKSYYLGNSNEQLKYKALQYLKENLFNEIYFHKILSNVVSETL